jgi:hypothetical protein
MKTTILLPLLLSGCLGYGQTADSTRSLTFSGFADIFYQFDFNRPVDNVRPGFLYNHNRHHEVNVNLALLKAAYLASGVRANVALMVGTYADDNLAAESGGTRHIYEANLGIRLGNRTWIDAGIIPSHIGFESAISKDCSTLTRSMVAENSPYFETGVKLTFQPNEEWTLAALYLNGWQRVARPPGNSVPAFGTQLMWKPDKKVTLNYSTFLGSEKPDSSRSMRQYNNVYGIFTVAQGMEFTIGFDVGLEQVRKGSSEFNTWYSPVLIMRYLVSQRFALAARAEYFVDRSGVIIAPFQGQAFGATGLSLNFDYQLSSQAMWRTEMRLLNSEGSIFVKNNGLSRTRPYAISSLAISF